MKVLDVSQEMEAKSRYGNTHENSRYWYWRDDEKNLVGRLKSVTEMEALDRLRESVPDACRIKWIGKSEYEECKAQSSKS